MKTANLLYKNILSTLEFEMEHFEKKLLTTVLENSNELEEDMLIFVGTPSKYIRPVLMFLILKSLDIEITEKHYAVAVATELLHSATLVHDDIIDNAKTRRDEVCWHRKYDSKLAVITGDYLLALSLKTLSGLQSTEIFEIFSNNVLKVCNGEISQYFKRFEATNIEEYLEKSKLKTGLLFLCAVKSALLLSNIQNKDVEEFVLNFGTAFQIHNDLKNSEDIENGVYTLSVIYYMQENSNCDIIKPDTRHTKKAMEFLNKFVDRTIEGINFTEGKTGLTALCELLREN